MGLGDLAREHEADAGAAGLRREERYEEVLGARQARAIVPVALSSDVQYFGEAYGSFANVADTVVAGRSWPVSLGGCGTLRPPLTRENVGASVTALPHLASGAVHSTVSALEDRGTRTSRTTSTVHAVNLLSGLIRASEIRSVSATSHDGASFRTSGNGSRLLGLVVAGVPVLVQPGPNTRMNLANIGHVILNEQIASVQATSASLVVNAIHVFVTLPNPVVPVGTEIIVAHAKSRLAETDAAGTLGGVAYGSFVQQGQLFLSGPSARVVMGCNGTGGAVRTNSIVTVDVGPVLGTGVVTNTASGVVSSGSATGVTTSTVAAVDLLSSLVTADAVHAEAHAFTDGNTFSFTDTGSSFVNLSVQGFPAIHDDVPANTRVRLPGLGNLWLKREIVSGNHIEVRMIELVVTSANAFGIPIGTVVRVGVASASAR